MEIEKGDEETILCFCISGVKGNKDIQFRWYGIDLSSHTEDKNKNKEEEEKRKFALFLSEFPIQDHGYEFGCVGMDSKVYLIGGNLVANGAYHLHRALSSSVHFIDTRIPGSYREGTRMIGGKAAPLTHAVDGKIYAFGCSVPNPVPDLDTLAQPWAEFFDPTTPNFWRALPDPSDEILKASSYDWGNLVFYEKANKFLLGYRNYGLTEGILFFFNLATNSYEYGLENIPISKQFLFSRGRHAVVGHTLYMFYPPDKCLYSYDLSMRNNLQSIPIIDGPPGLLSLPDDPDCPPSLFHLGKQKLCLVWFSWSSSAGFQIHYFVFHVEEGRVVGHNPLDHPYFLEDFEIVDFQNCLLLKRTPLGTAAAAPDCVDPGVQQTMLWTQETSQNTRLACRVHVSGIPSSTNEKTIKAFFDKLIKNYDSGGVVHVYFNDVKEFAIIEFSCEKEANNAVDRDCVLFEGKELKIRRPADYKCLMIWEGWEREEYEK